MDGVFHGKGINKIKKEDEDLFNVISELDEVVWQEGAISRKTKKLIAIAIVASKGNVGGLEKQIRSGKKQFGTGLPQGRGFFVFPPFIDGLPPFVVF